MSLATRCPACDTVFRITTHDATVQSGNVRCGVCDAVFNALDALIRMEDLEDAPPMEEVGIATASNLDTAPEPEEFDETALKISAETTPETSLEKVSLGTPSFAAPESYVLRDATFPDPSPSATLKEAEAASDAPVRVLPVLDLPPEQPSDAGSAQTEAISNANTASAIAPSDIDTIFDVAGPKTRIPGVSTSDLDLDLDQPTQGAELQPGAELPAETDAASDLLFAPPSFMNRQAALAASRPNRAKLWIAFSALAVVLLLAQAVYFWRDALAAQSPWANTTLRNACATLGCRIELPMRIEAITVESSELQAAPESANTTNGYMFSTLLRNHSATPLRYPALELTLTDATDQIVSRRVFLPEQYLDTAQRRRLQNGLAGNGELPIKINFEVADIKVVGYRVGVLYP